MSLDQSFSRAIRNISQHGDTDIFPYPIETLIFYDEKQEVIALLKEMAGGFDDFIARYPPANSNTLAPVGYSGFRWATQIDPIWNAFYLGIVLSIAERIEAVRVPIKDKVVFSYRYNYDADSCDMFFESPGWAEYMEHSLEICNEQAWIVVCDISEFYPRLNHHKLENSLLQLGLDGNQTHILKSFLSNFSNTYSFGLPVGGPASRLLSELLLDQVDRLLIDNGIKFCRFADDLHIFANSYEESFKNLVFLTDVLFRNQGLQLQKSKTRIMSSTEFQGTSLLSSKFADTSSTSLEGQAKELLRFSMRFDPYAANAQVDYDKLREQIQSIDIIGLLKSELSKSQIHISLSKKIVSALRYIKGEQQGGALVSLMQNHETLYPIFANVLTTVKALFDEVDVNSQNEVMRILRELIVSGSHVFSVDLNLSYAVRLLALQNAASNSEILTQIFRSSRSSIIRRDIILAMARWRKWTWLSDLRTSFRFLDPIERRAFIIASFYLAEEGKHWREHLKLEFTPFEKLVCKWTAKRSADSKWSIPL